MARPGKNDILQGTLALLVLQTLSARGPLHGYAITQHIQRGSNELLRVADGSLYPALHRRAEEALLKGKGDRTERNRPARIYAIPPKGRRQPELERAGWARLTDGVGRLL